MHVHVHVHVCVYAYTVYAYLYIWRKFLLLTGLQHKIIWLIPISSHPQPTCTCTSSPLLNMHSPSPVPLPHFLPPSPSLSTPPSLPSSLPHSSLPESAMYQGGREAILPAQPLSGCGESDTHMSESDMCTCICTCTQVHVLYMHVCLHTIPNLGQSTCYFHAYNIHE